MILLKQKNAIHYGLPPAPAPKPPSPWSSILWGDERRPRGGKTARGARVMQLRDKVTAKVDTCMLASLMSLSSCVGCSLRDLQESWLVFAIPHGGDRFIMLIKISFLTVEEEQEEQEEKEEEEEDDDNSLRFYAAFSQQNQEENAINEIKNSTLGWKEKNFNDAFVYSNISLYFTCFQLVLQQQQQQQWVETALTTSV
ncbi:hypothetical protein M0804_005970 [Polistes exclamans]|nr:hypothetical protein M0804_005970 [Polistes exclamans]